MKESGVKLPKTHLVDPHAALRGIKRAKRMLPLLAWKERKLRKKLAGQFHTKSVPRDAVSIVQNLEVY